MKAPSGRAKCREKGETVRPEPPADVEQEKSESKGEKEKTAIKVVRWEKREEKTHASMDFHLIVKGKRARNPKAIVCVSLCTGGGGGTGRKGERRENGHQLI